MRPVLILLAALAAAAPVRGKSAMQPVFQDGFEDEAALSAWGFSNGPEFPGAEGAFERSREQARSGRFSGKLSFDFKGGNYVHAYVRLPRGVDIGHIRFWLKKDVANRITVRVVDSENQTFQKSFDYSYDGWQEVSVSLDGWAGHWGGAADGVFRGSPTIFGVIVENNGAKRGAVYIDDVRALPGPAGAAGSFRAVYPVARFGDEEGWRVTSGGDAGQSRWQSPELRCDFSRGATAVGIETDAAINGRPVSLKLRLRSDGSGHAVRVRLGSHFQNFDRVVGRLEREGVMEFTAPVGAMQGWRFYGGENDGIPQYPLRLTGIIVDRSEGGPESAAVAFESLEVETTVPRELGVVLEPSGRAVSRSGVFKVRCLSFLPERVEGALHWGIYDWGGRPVRTGAAPLPLDPGVPGEFEISEPMAGRSFLECRFEYRSGGELYGPLTATAVVPVRLQADTQLDPSSPFGMGVYLYRYPGTPEGFAMMDRAAALAATAGVKWSREEFQWHRIERAKGEFEWDFYDRLIETAHRHGISVYGLIAYWSSWTQPYTREGIEDYARFCRALVTRYRDRIKHWEVWNEPNIFFWSGPKELYPELLKAAYAAIKEADPEAFVLGCSTAGIDGAFIRMVLDAGAPFDILTIHPYRGSLNERGFMKELQEVADLAGSRDGRRRPVWITEMGLPTHLYGGLSERNQALFLARCYLSALASGVDTNISWYNFREDGENRFYNEHNFGVVRHSDLAPKPGYRALATVCRTLAKKPLAGELDLGEGILGFVFGKEDGEQTAVIWSPERDALLTLEAGSRSGSPAVRDLMGDPVRPVKARGRWLLALPAGSPVFITGSGLSVKASRPLVTVETSGSARPGDQIQVVVRQAEPAVAGGISLSLPEGWKQTGTGGNFAAGTSFVVGIPENETRGHKEMLLKANVGGQELALPVGVEVMPAVLEI